MRVPWPGRAGTGAPPGPTGAPRAPGARAGRPWRRALVALVVLAAVVPALGRDPALAGGGVRPPVVAADRPDPELEHDGSRWVAYSTNAFAGSAITNVPVMVSTDMAAWSPAGDALPRLGSWASPGLTWSPGVVRRGGTWHLYYTALHTASGRQCIGLATSTSATGPFVDGRPGPVVCQLDRGGSIDPDPFVDPDGRAWLAWKSDDNVLGQPSRIWVQPLSGDGTPTGTAVAVLSADRTWEEGIVENPALVVAGGELWLFYAGGRWETAGYGIGVARCPAVGAPCAKPTEGPWMSRASTGVPGPGSPALLARPGLTPVLAFHGWVGGVGYPAGGRRALFVEPVDFTSGWPDWRPDWPRSTPLGGPWAQVLLRASPDPGPPEVAFSYGLGRYRHLLCDFDGDGVDGVVAFDRGNWHWRSTASPGPPEGSFAYGGPTDVPVCGDWDGDGADGIGVYAGASWYLRETASPGRPERAFAYGAPGWVPVVGDWDGGGADGIGVYHGGLWDLRRSPSPGPPHLSFAYGAPWYVPVVGRWAPGDPRTGIGVYGDGGRWYLRVAAGGGPPDLRFVYGTDAYRPLVGDLDGDGRDGAGVVVP
ncbi:MAG: glycoside hydrolase family 43 protein [Acidimicrobiia bacterium]